MTTGQHHCVGLIAILVGAGLMAVGPAAAASPTSETFLCTGAPASFTVPASGVGAVTFTVDGGQGGNSGNLGAQGGGLGGEVVGTFAVSPNQVFDLNVGCGGDTTGGSGTFTAGHGGYGGGGNGGADGGAASGGGGASTVVTGGTLLIAAGGGGGASEVAAGGDAGSTPAGNGDPGSSPCAPGGVCGQGGGGGRAAGPGGGGAGAIGASAGADGSGSNGGAGAAAPALTTATGGGGGGGGATGGGGGGSALTNGSPLRLIPGGAGGGGGGSSFVSATATNVTLGKAPPPNGSQLQGAPGQIDVSFVATGVTPTTTQLTASRTYVRAGTPVKFTATVSSAAGTPTGTATFADGIELLQTVPLTNGVATLTYAFSVSAIHHVTATYAPDALSNFAPSSGSVVVTVFIPPPPPPAPNPIVALIDAILALLGL